MNLFDSGYFRIRVPNGWMAFYGTDSSGKITQKKVHIYKDAKFETDIFTHVGITICFFGQRDIYLSTKDFYDNIVDMEPFTLGDYTWTGYTCTSLGYPYTILETRQDGSVFQVMILKKNGEHTIAFEDADVQTILTSLKQAKDNF